jgi:hypothetical protein
MSDETNPAEVKEESGSEDFDLGFTVDADTDGATGEGSQNEASEESEVAKSESTSSDEGADETSDTQTAEDSETQPSSEPGVPSTEPEKFTFLGKEYNSFKHAEEAIGSWEGRIRAEQERAGKYENQLQEYYRYVQETATKNDELLARLSELEGKGTEEKEPPKKFVDSIDWEEVGKVAELARNQGYDPAVVTQKMVAEQLEGFIEKAVESRVGPITETHKANEIESSIEGALSEMAYWAAETGKYPELQGESDKFSEDFVRSWYQTLEGFARNNPLFGFSEEGADYAYRLTRDKFGAASEAPTSETEPADTNDSTLARDDKGRFISARNAAADVVNSSKNIATVRNDDFDLGFVP